MKTCYTVLIAETKSLQGVPPPPLQSIPQGGYSKRWCTEEEQRRNNKLSNAGKLLPEALCSSVTKSMLRTDYTSLLSLPDTAMSYWALTFLHVYPVYIRLDQCSAGKVS